MVARSKVDYRMEFLALKRKLLTLLDNSSQPLKEAVAGRALVVETRDIFCESVQSGEI